MILSFMILFGPKIETILEAFQKDEAKAELALLSMFSATIFLPSVILSGGLDTPSTGALRGGERKQN